ncbi:DNA-binding transcriptional LysR family regulator [Pseudomonas sp. BIGb0450]|uniref:LysR family transcriptional regulator n=1 Tax=Pseudomonas TaxID=286 RepID=UPI0015A27D63|nr:MULTISPECIES: LysR family transcriptional regulator [Pseudomonas]MCS3420853.1 DNA-binding transcriptional LysR family regulator [Pseudomonas sp. BIGb0558]MCS3438829.1 DNA-binding transcriptional LysR family regulator [Pseudomonas sp. BIGb0450]NVZ85432.1 LysR family transcriptional regulator [Pseudomonas yamanorum]
MNPPLLQWETQRAFLAVLRTGSLSGAARLLGIAQATARRRIEALELSVGVSLFIRSPAGLLPTDTAKDLISHVEAMAVAANAFNRAASADAALAGGTVRLTSGKLLGVEVLPPMLRSLRRDHPQLAIELSVSNRLQALALQEADVAVRIRRPTEATVVARKVGDLQVGLYAAPELLAEQGTPDTVAQLHGYPLIGPDRNLLEIEFLRERGFDCSAPHAVIRTDDHLAQLAALRAGLGIGVCSGQVAQRHGLVRVLQGQVDFNVDVWIAMHQDMRKVQRIAVVFDALGGALADFLQPR